ncbi:MAG: hypothetical protein IIB57_12680 [Planctomycetes bacterium]|nr:hypothetical protein [Planctomycetota bacterium]
MDKSGRIQRFTSDGHMVHVWSMPATKKGKPVGLTVHPDGRVFVADTHYSRVVVFDRVGKILAMFGQEGNGDGEFQLPTDVAIDADGYIYVSEYHGNDRISKWTPDFTFVRAFGMEPIDGVRLSRPAAIDIDAAQTIWVADACNHRIVRFSRDGRVLGFFGHFGREAGGLRYPYDITVTPGGNLLVCEYGADRLQWFTEKGQSLRTWGGSGREPGRLSGPWGATIGFGGKVVVVDSLNSRIQIIRP